MPEYGRAPKAALERDISARLSRMPHVAVKGKGLGTAGTPSDGPRLLHCLRCFRNFPGCAGSTAPHKKTNTCQLGGVIGLSVPCRNRVTPSSLREGDLPPFCRHGSAELRGRGSQLLGSAGSRARKLRVIGRGDVVGSLAAPKMGPWVRIWRMFGIVFALCSYCSGIALELHHRCCSNTALVQQCYYLLTARLLYDCCIIPVLGPYTYCARLVRTGTGAMRVPMQYLCSTSLVQG